MATVSPPHPPALTITRIAEVHGLHRAEVRTLIAEHRVPTQFVGRARVVAPGDWPRLERVVRRYLEATGRPSPA